MPTHRNTSARPASRPRHAALLAALVCGVFGLLAAPARAEPRAFDEFFTLPDARLAHDTPAGIVAHRGLNRYAPENTFAAFALCAELGFAYIELDVRTTADGVLVVMHDETLDRTTNGSGRVRDKTWEELRTLDAGSWFGPAYTGQRVPRLDDVIAWAKGRIGIYFDVKDADPRALIDLVDRHGVHSSVFFWSGDRGFLRRLHALDASMPIKINPKSDAEIDMAREAFGAVICEFDRDTFTPERAARVRERGMRPMLYTNRDEPALFRAALQAGVELFNIDYVESFAREARAVQGG